MKKIKQSSTVHRWKHLLLLVVLAITGSLPALAQTTITPGVSFQISSNTDYEGVFTPESSGTLTINFNSAAGFTNGIDLLYTKSGDSYDLVAYESVATSAGLMGDQYNNFVYKVTKGTSYYFLLGTKNPKGCVLQASIMGAQSKTVTFKFEASEDGGDEDGGDEGGGDNPGGETTAGPTITPTSGTTLESITQIEFAYEGAMAVTLEDDINPTLTIDGKPTTFPSVDYDEESKPGSVFVKFPSALTEPGEYVFTFPEGSFYVVLGPLQGSSKEIVVKYTIEGNTSGGGEDNGVAYVSINPEVGTVSELSTITITWPSEYQYVSLSREAGKSLSATIVGNGKTITLEPYSTIKPGTFGTCNATITPNPAITEPGEYTITIPAGYFSLQDAVIGASLNDINSKIEVTYTVDDNAGGGDVEPTPDYSNVKTTITPAEGIVESLSSVKVVWDGSTLVNNNLKATLSINGGEPIEVSYGVAQGSPGLPPLMPATAGSLEITFDQSYTTPGTYVVTIPGGAVTVGGDKKPNAPIELTYTIKAPEVVIPEPTLTPNEGTSLSSVDITWGDLAIEEHEDYRYTNLRLYFPDGDYEYVSYGADGDVTFESNAIHIDFETPFTTPGTYKFEIDEDVVTFPAAGNKSNAAASLTYTVKAPAVAPTPVVTPASGEKAEKITEILLDWDTPVAQAVEGNVKVTVTHNGTATENYFFASSCEGNATTLTLSPNISTPGTYVITIPAGSYKFSELGDITNEAVILTYEIEATLNGKPASITPDTDEVESLEVITLKWTDGYGAWVNDDTTPATVEFGGNKVDIPADNINPGYFGGTSTITLPQEYTEAGEYTITFPAGYFKVGPAINNTVLSETIVLNFTIQGGGGTEVPTGPYTVDPASGTTHEALPENVTIYFDTPGAVRKATSGTATITLPGGSSEDIQSLISINTDEKYDYYVAIDLSNIASEEGDYTINISEGYFNIGGVSMPGGVLGADPSPAVTIVYTVEGEEVTEPAIVSVDPATGEVTSLSKVVITYNTKVVDPNVGGFWGGASANIYKGNDYLTYVIISIEDEKNIVIDLNDPITEPGEYRINIPEYSLTFPEFNDDYNLEPINLYYTIVEGSDDEGIAPMYTEPATGDEVSQLDKLTLNWAEGYAIAPSADAQQGKLFATVTGPDGTPVNIPANKMIGNARPYFNPTTVTMPEVYATAGEYTITIPAGYYAVTTAPEEVKPSAEIVVKVTVTGVTPPPSIIVEDVPFTLENPYILGYEGEFTPSKTGTLVIHYDPNAPGNFGNRNFLFESDQETAVAILSYTEGTGYTNDFKYLVTGGEKYYFMVGNKNPQGTVMGSATSSYKIVFTMAEDTPPTPTIPEPTINPTEGASFTSVEITWEGMTLAEGDAAWTSIEFDDEYIGYRDTYSVSNNVLTITAASPFTTPGTHTVKVGADVVRFVNMNNQPNEPFSFTYTITSSGGDDDKYTKAPYTVDPVTGQVTSLSTVTITFPGNLLLQENRGKATLVIDNGTPIEVDLTSNRGREEWLTGSVQTPGSITVNLGQTYTADGTYVITIPAEFVSIYADRLPTPEFKLTYTIGEGGDIPVPGEAFTVNPAEGDYDLDEFELGYITLNFEEEIIAGTPFVTVNKDGQTTNLIATGAVAEDGYNFIIKVNDGDGVTEAGEYVVVIAEGSFQYAESGAFNEKIELEYILSGGGVEPAPDYKFSVNPAEGLVANLSTIELTFEAEIEGAWMGPDVTVKRGDELLDVELESGVDETVAEPHVFFIDFAEPITEEGTYTITIPAGSFSILPGYEENKEIVLVYTIGEGGDVPVPGDGYTVTPASSTDPREALPETVTIVFGEGIHQIAFNEGEGLNATLTFGDSQPVNINEDIVIKHDAIYSVEIDLSNVTSQEGTYTIIIPAGYFYIDGVVIAGDFYGTELSPAIEIFYVVGETESDGILGIVADGNGFYNVYNFNGVRVLSTDNGADLKLLESGMYIINGKKVVIRK